MKNWIKKMNEMFEANVYTNNKRVTIDWCENSNCVLVKVCGLSATIEADGFNDYGLMIECMKVVNILINNINDRDRILERA